MKTDKDILLCDLDAFYASVEQRDNPELRGKPILIGGAPEGRGVVSTCSYEARTFGVRSAMPMKKALALCPEAIVLPPDMNRYLAASGQVRELLERFTPEIEFVSIDEAYLAVPGGKGCKTGHQIHSAVIENLSLPISVGVSKNKLLAKIGCERAKPNKVGTLWPEEVPQILWPLPVTTIPGIGPASAEKLKRQGVITVGDLAAYPEENLVRLLGQAARTQLLYARGIDNRVIVSEHEAKSISEETTFSEDVENPEYLLAVLQELSAGVGYRLRTAKVSASTITLKLRFGNFRTISRSTTFTGATDSDSQIYAAVKELFKQNCGTSPWRLAGVQASGLQRDIQLSILPRMPGGEKEEQLQSVRDLLRNKYGTATIFKAGKLIIKEKDRP